MALLALGLAFPAALAVAFAWGLCVAGFQSLGRAILQEAAPAASRARVLSVYSLSVMGAGVVGSPLAGLAAGQLGPQRAIALIGALLLAFVAAVVATTRVAQVR